MPGWIRYSRASAPEAVVWLTEAKTLPATGRYPSGEPKISEKAKCKATDVSPTPLINNPVSLTFLKNGETTSGFNRSLISMVGYFIVKQRLSESVPSH